MSNIFPNNIYANSGNAYWPSISFVNDKLSGLSVADDNTLCLSSRGQIIAKYNYNYIEFTKRIYIPTGAKNNAVLTSDIQGKASWVISKLSGLFRWNSVYKDLDITKPNNETFINFSSPLEQSSVSLTKECDYVIDDFDIFIKNKSKDGFTLYTGSPMVTNAVTGEVNEYASTTLINNNIGICYYDINLDRMMYTYEYDDAEDANSTFSTPIHIDDVSAVGVCSMTVVNGHPAIVYISDDGSDDKWRYVRANDENGTSWGSPVILLSSSVDITFMPLTLILKVINSIPTVFLSDETNRVKTIISDDIDGNVWPKPTNVSNLTNHQILDFKNIEGRPAIIAKSNTTNYIYYVRSSDINGSSWPIGATQIYKTVNGTRSALCGNIGKSNNSINYINGVLCIAITSIDNSIYIATYGENGEWRDASLITQTNTSGTYLTMFINNGRTYMLYNDLSGQLSKKHLIEFAKNGVVVSNVEFINTLNFCTDHQVLYTKKNTILVLASRQGLNLVKFYGNDFIINWTANVVN